MVTVRMARLTLEAIDAAIDLVDGEPYSEEKAGRVEALEAKIDLYEDNLGTYMVKLSHAKLSGEDSHTVSMLLHSISDFERISDHAVNVLRSAREMREKKLSFSPQAAAELHVFAEAVRDIARRTVDCFDRGDLELAATVEPLESCIDQINSKVKSRHIERLTAGQCTIELGFILQDICTNFERVSDHCSNIALCQIQVPNDELDTHEYSQNVRKTDRDHFTEVRRQYQERYALPDAQQ